MENTKFDIAVLRAHTKALLMAGTEIESKIPEGGQGKGYWLCYCENMKKSLSNLDCLDNLLP